MLKALIVKQFRELVALMLRSGKSGDKNRTRNTVLYGILMLYVVGVFFFMFYSMANTLCAPLCDNDLDWLYFALMSFLATAVGIIGSVFMTQSMLFEAKDNEQLLSMPIPASVVLFSRMLVLYVQTLVFEFLIMLPALIVYWRQFSVNSVSVIGAVVVILILPLLALAISCILGWIIALISSRMHNKSLISLILFAVFFAGYLYVYSNINRVFQSILANSVAVGNSMKVAVYPLYQLGLGMCGSLLSLAVFFGIALAVFGLVYYVLSKSFIRIATTKRGAARVKYTEQKLKISSPSNALLRREFIHFWKSPVYMINSALGTVTFVIGAVAAVVKAGALRSVLGQLSVFSIPLSLLLAAAACMITSMNTYTSPSVSLEGRTLWLVRSLPVTGMNVLNSKLMLHLYMSVPVALICTPVVAVIIGIDLANTIVAVLIAVVFTVLSACFGLIMNLKFPNLDWTNETVAVKQSMSVILTLLMGWAAVFALFGLYMLIGRFMTELVFGLICLAFLSVLTVLSYVWLRRKGTMIFERL